LPEKTNFAGSIITETRGKRRKLRAIGEKSNKRGEKPLPEPHRKESKSPEKADTDRE